jgi:ribokinase
MITVFGSINVDLVCRVAAVPRPGQTVRGSDYDLIAGGKGANQALAARRAGADVRLAGAVGTDDEMAQTALAELRAGGVDLAGVLVRGERTGLAIITVDETGENTIIVSPGANARAEATAIPEFTDGGTLLLQMEVPFEESVTAARAAAAAGARTIFSIAPFSPLSPEQLEPFSMILVNEHEAADLAGVLGISGADPAATVGALAQRLERTVIATLGPDGAVAAGRHGEIRVPAIPVQVVDTTGAGDTFAGTLAAFLDEGLDLAAAMRLAAIAGSLACTKEGAQPSFPHRREIDQAARPG